MKIVTWNCQGAYRKKSDIIASYKPDIAIIQECECPEKLLFGKAYIPPSANKWFGSNKNSGISIMSYTGLKLSVDDSYDPSIEWCIPIKVSGHINLNLIAVCGYIRDVSQAVDSYRNFIHSGETIIIGDFNSNPSIRRTAKIFKEVVNKLKEIGMASVYHELTKEEHGAETQFTYFTRRHKDESFHIDYCFLPSSWISKVKLFEVGEYETWTEYSDHSPLKIEI